MHHTHSVGRPRNMGEMQSARPIGATRPNIWPKVDLSHVRYRRDNNNRNSGRGRHAWSVDTLGTFTTTMPSPSLERTAQVIAENVVSAFERQCEGRAASSRPAKTWRWPA